MRQAFVKFLLLFLPTLPLIAQEEDQLHVIFGSSGYVLYKVLDFANDHGYRYMQILSYEFNDYNHKISCECATTSQQGRFFELKDNTAKVSFLCFNEPPDNPCIIDLEKYRAILDSIAYQSEQ